MLYEEKFSLEEVQTMLVQWMVLYGKDTWMPFRQVDADLKSKLSFNEYIEHDFKTYIDIDGEGHGSHWRISPKGLAVINKVSQGESDE